MDAGAQDRALLAALGPLAPLYVDQIVTEIRVDAPDRVYVVRKGKIEDVPGVFSSGEEVRRIIDATLALSGLALEEGRTVGESRLSDGSHFVAVIPPTSGDAPVLAIHRMSRSPLDWHKLIELKVLTELAQSLVSSFLRTEVGILVAGNSGSGKTTLANLIAESIGPDRRVVVVQDLVDMPVRHPRAIHLEANLLARVTVSELLETAARLRPDWVVICELRGPETLRALQVMSAGHAGITIVHANSAEDALLRVESMCQMGSAGIGLFEIRSLIASALQIVVFQERLASGRRLTNIADVYLIGDRLEARSMLRYNPAHDQLEPAGLPAEQRIKEYLTSGFAQAERRQRVVRR